MPADDRHPLGAIFDTNSSGRFDLVVYDDGLLAVTGSYVGVALRGAAAGAQTGGVSPGWAAGESYETKRLARVLQTARADLIHTEPNFFIPRASIVNLVLRKRWHGHSLIVTTDEEPDGRRFDWKPKLNNFAGVEELLTSAFPGLVRRE